MIELRHLTVLRAVSERGSLSAAARQLGYTQPAVSQQIQRLERLLGTPLVVRGRSGASLTEAGRVLLRHGRSILDTVSLAEAEVAAIAGLRAGRVRLAAFPSAAATIVASAMATMMGTFPGVTFTLTEAEPARAVDLVERGECDIAVVFHYSTFEASANDNLAWIPLMEEAVHIVLPGEHPLVDADEVALRSLRDSRWIAGCPDCRGYLVQACHRAGFAPDIAFETDDYVALQNLALRGLGVALLPDLVLAAVRLDGLHVRPLKQDDTRMVSAVSTRAFATVPGIRETLNSLRRECAPEGPWLNASGRSSS